MSSLWMVPLILYDFISKVVLKKKSVVVSGYYVWCILNHSTLDQSNEPKFKH